MSSHTPSPNDVRFFNRKTIFSEHIKIDKVDVAFQMSDKSWAPALSQFVVASGAKVVVLPFDPYKGVVVFTETFRIGTLEQPEGPWHLELPSRHLHANEKVEIAYQTLREEIACEGLDLEFIGDFFTSPGLSTEKIFLYCAGVDTNLLKVEGKIEALSVEDAIEAVNGNYFRDSSTIISLHWLVANKKRLEDKWR